MKLIDKIKTDSKHTIAACSISYCVQAIVNNFLPLLFVFISGSFNISLSKITTLVTINFGIQLVVDMLSTAIITKFGYRKSVLASNFFAAMGLILLGILPYVMNPYIGLMISIFVYAVGGGLIEVAVSPIVDATNKKASVMSLLHSFYSWGHIIVIVFSTLFFKLFGMEMWRYAAFLWALWPLFDMVYFGFIHIPNIPTGRESGGLKGLIKSSTFRIMFLLMICAGAAELAMAQWASAFVEKGLNVSKTTGDLLGTLMFALFMGVSRILTSKILKKIKLETFMQISAVLCIISYIIATCINNPVFGLAGCGLCGFSVGIMWPGTYSLASKNIPKGGTLMFALLAFGGDIGASFGPTLVGFVSGLFGDNLKIGLLSAIIFPIVLLIGNCMPIKNKDK